MYHYHTLSILIQTAENDDQKRCCKCWKCSCDNSCSLLKWKRLEGLGIMSLGLSSLSARFNVVTFFSCFENERKTDAYFINIRKTALRFVEHCWFNEGIHLAYSSHKLKSVCVCVCVCVCVDSLAFFVQCPPLQNGHNTNFTGLWGLNIVFFCRRCLVI